MPLKVLITLIENRSFSLKLNEYILILIITVFRATKRRGIRKETSRRIRKEAPRRFRETKKRRGGKATKARVRKRTTTQIGTNKT